MKFVRHAFLFFPVALGWLAAESPVRADGPVLTGGPCEVRIVRDIAYREGPGVDAKKHKLDLFLPKGRKDFPVVFFIHGGAWSWGDRRMYSNFGHTFARNGVGAVVVSYRLSPEVQHPAHVEDVAAAFAWTRRNIARYDGRPDQIFVTGQSAGGHLAALLATNERYLTAEGCSIKDIKGVMPMSGVYTVPAGRLSRIFGNDPEALRDASPLAHVTGKEPPFLILYADNDFSGCAAMSRALDAALRKQKVESACIEIKERNHISIMFKLMMNEADPATQALLSFVARHSGLTLTERDAVKAAPESGRVKGGSS